MTVQPKLSPAAEAPEAPYIYRWPPDDLRKRPVWRDAADGLHIERDMPETPEEVAKDSRWPGFFSQPLCVMTTEHGGQVFLEREVGPCIVNRFPYVMTISLCRDPLSDRHEPRRQFMEAMEKSGHCSVQFLTMGDALDAAMGAINDCPEGQVEKRIAASGLKTRPGLSNPSPVLEGAYMVYEAKLLQPMEDLYGNRIYEKPYFDIGSHRLYFLEVNCIQLREDIAKGGEQISWTSLAEWPEGRQITDGAEPDTSALARMAYVKPFTPYYKFPAANTIAFEYEGVSDGMAYQHLESFVRSKVDEIDNDKTRWPCFFPSSLGLITSWSKDGQPNLMPCGSTTVVSRSPFVISPAVTYGGINDRYRARHTLNNIRETGWFGCGLASVSDKIISAIRYAGNISVLDDPEKLRNTGLAFDDGEHAPILRNCPIHFDCEVVDEVKLGTHAMFMGKVRRILVRKDAAYAGSLTWSPWPVVW